MTEHTDWLNDCIEEIKADTDSLAFGMPAVRALVAEIERLRTQLENLRPLARDANDRWDAWLADDSQRFPPPEFLEAVSTLIGAALKVTP